MAEVSGKIHVPNDANFDNATVFVKLEDVSMAGASASVIGRQTMRGVSAGDDLHYMIDGIDVDERSRYNVRVHLSLDGSDQYKSGDYLTTQTYPALTQGHPAVVDVKLSRI